MKKQDCFDYVERRALIDIESMYRHFVQGGEGRTGQQGGRVERPSCCELDALMIISLDGRVLYANRSMKNIWGQDCSLIGLGFTELWKNTSLAKQVFQEVVSQGEGRSLLVGKDNNQEFQFEGELVTSPEGVPIQVMGTFLGSGHIGRKGNCCETLNQLLHSLTDARDMMYKLNLITGEYTFISPSSERVVGYTAEEVMELGFHGVLNRIYPDDQVKMKEAFDYLQEQSGKKVGSAEVRYRFKGKDGKYRWLSDSGTLICNADGRPEALVGSVRNVTEQVLAEEELRYRLRVEKMISTVSSMFIHHTDLGEAILKALAEVGEIAEADRSYVLIGENRPDEVYEWHKEGYADLTHAVKELRYEEYPWWRRMMEEYQIIHVADVSNMPEEARAEQQMYQSFGLKAIMVLPIFIHGELGGVFGIVDMEKTGGWSEENVMLIRVAVEILATAIERDRSIKQLTRDRNQMQAIMSNLPDLIFVKDRESRFLGANQATAEHFGKYSVEEILGKTDSELMDREQADVFYQEEREVIEHGRALVQEERVRRFEDGSELAFSSTKVPWRDENGDIIGLIGLNRDITAIKQAQEELKESESRFRKLLEGIPNIAVQGYDLNGTVLYWNKASEEIYGYAREEAFGKNLVDLIIPPDMREVVKEVIKKGAETGEMPPTEELMLMRKDGTLVPVLSSHSVIQRINGELELYCVDIDLTDLKAAENGLIKANDELELRVKERTAELSKLNERLQKEVKERERIERKLIDYQGKLRSLASQLTLTEQRERRRIATELHDNVGQWLAFSMLKLGCIREDALKTDFDEPIAEISELIEKAIQDTRSIVFNMGCPVLYGNGFEAAVEEWLIEEVEKRHKLKCEFYDDGQPKDLDEDVCVLLFESVRELLVNVVKHAKASIVKVEISRDDHNIRVVVEDDGIGFSLGEGRFNWGRESGFGLFSIRERLDYFNGWFKVDSEPNQGARITLSVPLKKASEGTV